MKKLTHNLAAKIIAIFLFALSEIAGILSLIGALFLYESGAYTEGSSALDLGRMGVELYGMRYGLIVIFAICVLLFLAALIFLLCSAGHRHGEEEVVLNHQDRIPLDLYMVVASFIAIFLLSIAFSGGYGVGFPYELAGLGISILLASLVVLAALMTIATRLKVGKWWRNSLIFRICSLIKRFFRKLPLMWKTALAAAVFSFFNLIFAAICTGEGAAIILVFLLDCLLIAGSCLAAVQLKKLKKAGEELAGGNFDYKVDTAKMFWEFKKHGENLNSIGDGMSIALERQMKSERLKTDLITNVSHDIKTPLTSIINYVDLLSREGADGKSAEYIEVLDRQAQRLKKLTEDLVEASKASSGNIAANLVRTDVRELADQSTAEYAEKLAAAKLEAIVSSPEGGCHAMADGRLLWRILDNLLSNACKYSQPGTRVYIDVREEAGRALLSVKSISRQQLNVSSDELMERFVRGDSSRSTEGSGLGLNIARSLAELQHGVLKLTIDGDLFKAEVSLPSA